MANSKIKQILVGSTTYDIEDAGAAKLASDNTFTGINIFKSGLKVPTTSTFNYGFKTESGVWFSVKEKTNVASTVNSQRSKTVGGTSTSVSDGQGYIVTGSFTPEGVNPTNVTIEKLSANYTNGQASYNADSNSISWTIWCSKKNTTCKATVRYTSNDTITACAIASHPKNAANMEYLAALPNKSGTIAMLDDIPDTSGASGGVTSVTTSGTGNAVTSASISGNTLTLTKGSTFLTSHQSLASCAKLSSNNIFTGTNTFKNPVTIKGTSSPHALKIEFDQGSTTYHQGLIQYQPSKTGSTYNLIMPAKDGTLALTSDIPTVVANPAAAGTATLTKLKVGSTVYTLPSGGGGGTAGVSSLGGKTGAITLGGGLSMSNNQLVPKIKNIYLDSSDYLCIETN